MRRYLLIFFFSGQLLYSQLETSKWHFGNFAALDFQNGAPVFVNNSGLSDSWYGQSSIADSAGNLLFYTNGIWVYNKNNAFMGPSILVSGSGGGVFSSLSLRKTGKKYYLIHGGLGIPHSIRFAEVDMALAAGLGSLTAIGVPLSPLNVQMSHKLTGTLHCNGKDYWVLSHVASNTVMARDFLAYHVSADSINRNPVVSTIGSHQPFLTNGVAAISGRGMMKFSPNGRKLAAVFNPYCAVELYDFDNATGQISNMVQLEGLDSAVTPNSPNNPMAFSVEFSPDGSKLYVSYINNRPAICQYDLAAGSVSNIIASKTIICADTFPVPGATVSNTYSEMRHFQNAPDGKIYVTDNNLPSLGVINNPNAPGLLCGYSAGAVTLGINQLYNNNTQTICQRHLPNFVTGFFEQKPVIPPPTATLTCGTASFALPAMNAVAGYSITSHQWNFGDPISGVANTSTLDNPGHTFSANGTFTVKLVVNYRCGADTLRTTVTINGLPELTITSSTNICMGETVHPYFSGAGSYSLNGIAIAQPSTVMQPSVSGSYTITGSDPTTGCLSSKVFSIAVMACNGTDQIGDPDERIRVTPNPSDGLFSIRLSEAAFIEVRDLSGRLVFDSGVKTRELVIDLSSYANGFYLLNSRSNKGSQIVKLLKQ